MFLYKHTNIKNKKVYIGITKKHPYVRWDDGNNYKTNKNFYADIKQFGWNEGFTHEIIFDALSEKEAKIKECEYILKYDSVDNGYNTKYCDCIDILPENLKQIVLQKRASKSKTCKKNEKTVFDYYNFPIINKTDKKYKIINSYFTRIPNKFIKTNIQKEFGLNRIFLIVFILIDRHRSYEDTSYLTIGQVLDTCGYKRTKNKPKIFHEIIKSLMFLEVNNYIDIDFFDIYTVGYDDCITLKIITENFDSSEDFTKIYGKDFDSIMNSNEKPTKESMLTSFLYINSYIGCRPRNDDGTEKMYNPETKPEAFWRSIECMSKDLSMSKDTITQCIDYLTTSIGDKDALLIKKEVGSIQPDKNKPPKNVPNIYVLNKEGYQQEIEWALSKMMEVYGVTEFDKTKGGKKN